ncbi:hypothetical protein niasHS_017974 [Heterodera schachtii]|uniref:Uncharacterized protein n=1 Tax=Heterodera schachtii TaxID=97005 RepID=A0ABD2I661_HETSC
MFPKFVIQCIGANKADNDVCLFSSTITGEEAQGALSVCANQKFICHPCVPVGQKHSLTLTFLWCALAAVVQPFGRWESGGGGGGQQQRHPPPNKMNCTTKHKNAQQRNPRRSHFRFVTSSVRPVRRVPSALFRPSPTAISVLFIGWGKAPAEAENGWQQQQLKNELKEEEEEDSQEREIKRLAAAEQRDKNPSVRPLSVVSSCCASSIKWLLLLCVVCCAAAPSPPPIIQSKIRDFHALGRAVLVGRSVSRAPSLSPYLPTKIFSPRAPPRGALPPAFLSFVQPQQNDDDDKIPSFGLMGWDGEQQIHPRARRGALGQGEEGLIICPSVGRPTDRPFPSVFSAGGTHNGAGTGTTQLHPLGRFTRIGKKGYVLGCQKRGQISDRKKC